MQILLSCPNLQGTLSRYALCVLDVESGVFQWVDTAAFLDPATDLGITGIVRAGEGFLLGIQSPSRPRLVELTADLRYVRTVTIDGLTDPHGMAVIGDTVFVASTGTNTIFAYDPATGRSRPHWRFAQNFVQDALHVSSLLARGGALLATTHHDPRAYPSRDGQGCVWDTGRGAPLIVGLRRPHSLALVADQVHVLNSHRGEVLRLDAAGAIAHRATIGGFLRGMAPAGDHLLVAVSSHRLHSRKQGPMVGYEELDAWIAEGKFRSAVALLDPVTLAERRRYDFTLLAPEIFDAAPLEVPPDPRMLIGEPALLRCAIMQHEIWMLRRRIDQQATALVRLRDDARRRILFEQAVLTVDGIEGGALRGSAVDPARPGGAVHVRVVVDDRHVFYVRAEPVRSQFTLQIPAGVLAESDRHVVTLDVPDAARCEPITVELCMSAIRPSGREAVSASGATAP